MARLLIFWAVLLLTLVSCSNGFVRQLEGVEQNSVPTNVRTYRAAPADVEERVVLSGEISSAVEVNVVPEISGLLTRILVSPGDTVFFDQVIAFVDPSRPGMVYVESPVRSKAVGTVTRVPAFAGNQVTPQTVIAQVGNLNDLEISVHVPERHLASLSPGVTGRVTSRAFPDHPESAVVTKVSPIVDSRTRTVEVTLVPEVGSKLRIGQAVRVDLILDTHQDVLAVPVSAITERQAGIGVFVVENDLAVWRDVETGIVDDGMVEVVEGLDSDDLVVIAGADLISNGSLVRAL